MYIIYVKKKILLLNLSLADGTFMSEYHTNVSFDFKRLGKVIFTIFIFDILP